MTKTVKEILEEVQNASTPEELETLIQHRYERVRYAIASHPAADINIMTELLNVDGRYPTVLKMLSNHSITEEMVNRIFTFSYSETILFEGAPLETSYNTKKDASLMLKAPINRSFASALRPESEESKTIAPATVEYILKHINSDIAQMTIHMLPGAMAAASLTKEMVLDHLPNIIASAPTSRTEYLAGVCFPLFARDEEWVPEVEEYYIKNLDSQPLMWSIAAESRNNDHILAATDKFFTLYETNPTNEDPESHDREKMKMLRSVLCNPYAEIPLLVAAEVAFASYGGSYRSAAEGIAKKTIAEKSADFLKEHNMPAVVGIYAEKVVRQLCAEMGHDIPPVFWCKKADS